VENSKEKDSVSRFACGSAPIFQHDRLLQGCNRIIFNTILLVYTAVELHHIVAHTIVDNRTQKKDIITVNAIESL
jgi:hypothetical protein